MRVSVLYFGVLRDMFGASDEMVETVEGIMVEELLAMLREVLLERASNEAVTGGVGEGLDERLWRSLAVAVNREYSALDAVLRDGDEVALLPPVSGGCFAFNDEAWTGRAPC